MRYAADGVDVAEHKMPAQFLTGIEWLFKIDARAFFQFATLGAERSLANRLAGKIRGEPAIVEINNGQAAAVHRDAV